LLSFVERPDGRSTSEGMLGWKWRAQVEVHADGNAKPGHRRCCHHGQRDLLARMSRIGPRPSRASKRNELAEGLDARGNTPARFRLPADRDAAIGLCAVGPAVAPESPSYRGSTRRSRNRRSSAGSSEPAFSRPRVEQCRAKRPASTPSLGSREDRFAAASLQASVIGLARTVAEPAAAEFPRAHKRGARRVSGVLAQPCALDGIKSPANRAGLP